MGPAWGSLWSFSLIRGGGVVVLARGLGHQRPDAIQVLGANDELQLSWEMNPLAHPDHDDPARGVARDPLDSP